MIVWMVVDKTEFSLPLGFYDTLKHTCDMWGVPVETVKTALKRHGFYKGKYFDILRVHIDV